MELETIIQDAVDDSLTAQEPVESPTTNDLAAPDPVPSEPVEVSPEGSEGRLRDELGRFVSAPADSPEQVPSPAKPEEQVTQEAVDEFSKRFGIPAMGASGRENRIPYSRVKKIIEKNEKDLRDRLTKEMEGTWQPKVTDFETKVKDYEDRLGKVAQFEHILENEPERFLQMLSQLPAYSGFFQAVQAWQTAQSQPAAPAQDPNAGMPQPDQQLTDGSWVYSTEGLNKLLQWQADQVQARVTNQLTERYKPIESQWQAQQRIQALIPQIDKKIAEARTWPHFNENEDAITKALQANPNLTLEGAYSQVLITSVLPRLQTDAAKMEAQIRAKVLDDIRKAPPVTTSAPTVATRAAQPHVSSGSIEDVIRAQVEKLK